MADKKKRISQLVFKNISDIILSELKNPLCKLASVNEVRLNSDNSLATVYVTHLEKEKADDLIKYLVSEKGFIRSKLAKKMDIYKIPDITFKKDDLYDQALKIDELLEKSLNEKPKTLKDIPTIKKTKKAKTTKIK